MAKHSAPRGGRKIISLKEHLEPAKASPAPEEEAAQATVTYEEEPPKEAPKAPKAFYRAALILLLLALLLALWVNREHLTPQNIAAWVQTQVMGGASGDGYPVALTGSVVAQGNVDAWGGNGVVLSDTAFTILTPSGEEALSLRHSLSQPVLQSAGGVYLLYNQGGPGYVVVQGTKQSLEGTAQGDILAGAVAANGRFALATRGEEGACDLTVYLEDGEVQYTYHFAQDYVTCLALNPQGTGGLACTARSQGGELISKVTAFHFDDPNPQATFETSDNLLLGAFWGENGSLYAVGDTALLRAKASDFAWQEDPYGGRTPTAFRFSGSQVYLSISAYEHAGPCTLLCYRGLEDPVEIATGERVEALSVYGNTVGTLEDQELVLYDASTGQELARAAAGADAKSLALSSGSAAYVLGVSEVRRVFFE